MRFAYPYVFILLLLLPYLLKQFRRKGRSAVIKFSTLKIVKTIRPNKKVLMRKYLIHARLIAIALIVIALARPQSTHHIEEIISKGIDIILAIDVSGSMKAEDFKPNDRLDAAKYVVQDFINGRKNDRIGMTIFAGEAFTRCPLTLDYGILLSFLKQLKHGIVERDGTAIGMAIASSLNRLRRTDAQSKIIILLTDGENNSGKIDPITAGNMAKALNVKIYTIAMGRKEGAPIPIDHPLLGKIYQKNPDGSLALTKVDASSLQEIADTTGGKFFWAENEQKLKEIYATIDRMEKTDIKTKNYTKYKELFFYPALAALLIILLETAAAHTILRKIP